MDGYASGGGHPQRKAEAQSLKAETQAGCPDYHHHHLQTWLASPERLSTFYKLNLSRRDKTKICPNYGLVNYMVHRPGGLKVPRRTPELGQPDLASDTWGAKAQGLAEVPASTRHFQIP